MLHGKLMITCLSNKKDFREKIQLMLLYYLFKKVFVLGQENKKTRKIMTQHKQ